MVTLFAVLAAMFVLAGAVAMRVARGGRSASLGAMSDQWLAEHRASHNRPPGD